MTFSPSGYVKNSIERSPHARTLNLYTSAKVLIGELTGLLLHTQPDDPPSFLIPRAATYAPDVIQGTLLEAPGFISTGQPTRYQYYHVDGTRSDGAYMVYINLRSHVR